MRFISLKQMAVRCPLTTVRVCGWTSPSAGWMCSPCCPVSPIQPFRTSQLLESAPSNPRRIESSWESFTIDANRFCCSIILQCQSERSRFEIRRFSHSIILQWENYLNNLVCIVKVRENYLKCVFFSFKNSTKIQDRYERFSDGGNYLKYVFPFEHSTKIN